MGLITIPIGAIQKEENRLFFTNPAKLSDNPFGAIPETGKWGEL
jgi:hypothetical protein